MNTWVDTYMRRLAFWPWLVRVMKSFMDVKPWSTVLVIAFMALGRATSFLALFLPIKILLLAGAEGVPRYFQPFVDPDAKMLWITYMALAAVVLYLLTLALDSASERLAERASADILTANRKLNVLERQEYRAQAYFSRFCRFCASVVYSVLAVLVLLFVHPWLIVFLFVVILLEYGITEWALSGRADGVKRRLRIFILTRTSFYINTLVSVNVLLGFLFILSPFVIADGSNLIVALVSMLLTRQILRQLGSAARSAVALEERRNRIDVLMFRAMPVLSGPAKEIARLLDLFTEDRRRPILADMLNVAPESVHSVWQDSVVPGVTQFRVSVKEQTGEAYFQYQVYTSQRARQLKNEDFLFTYIERERVWAPAVAGRCSVEGYESRLLVCGREAPDEEAWEVWRERWRRCLWACPLPAEVVESFCATHALLGQRLTPERLAPISIALDTHEDRTAFRRVCQELPSIQERLAAMPLHITNRDSGVGHVMYGPDQESIRIMSWRRWRLEPFGVGVDPAYDRDLLAGDLQEAARQRADVSEFPAIDDLYFVNDCWALDQAVDKGAYATAVRRLHVLLDRLDS